MKEISINAKDFFDAGKYRDTDTVVTLDNGDVHSFGSCDATAYGNGRAVAYDSGMAVAHGSGEAYTLGVGDAITHLGGGAFAYGGGNATAYGDGNATTINGGVATVHGAGEAAELSWEDIMPKDNTIVVPRNKGSKMKKQIMAPYGGMVKRTDGASSTCDTHEKDGKPLDPDKDTEQEWM